MPKMDILTIAGKKSVKIDLPKKIFAARTSKHLMAQAVRVYLANKRKAKAKTKTRGEVRGSGRKIWRQKGTGRARHGDRYAPIFVGGGRAHGPTGQENYRLKMSKKMRRAALFSALTNKFNEGEILVVKGLDKVEPKTKEMVKVFKNLKIEDLKILLILPGIMENVIRAARNIKGVRLAQASLLNTYEVLNGGKLILLQESVDVIKDTFIDKANRKKATLKRRTS